MHINKVLAVLIIFFSLLFFSFGCVERNKYEISLEESDKLLEIVLEDNLSKQQRMDALIDLTNTIRKLLHTEESTLLSDTELEGIFFNHISATSKALGSEESNAKIRIISYVGPSELYENHSRTWTFIQWWDDANVNSQTIIEGGPEIVTDFILQRAVESHVVTLVGYTDAYFPPPVFSKSFILNNNVWETISISPAEAFDLKTYWYFENNDEVIVIDHLIVGSIRVNISEQGDGFYVYSEMNPRDKLYFKFGDTALNYKLFESPHLIINSSGQTIDHINMFSDIEIETSDITTDDPSSLNISEVVELETYETFESLDDSKYMIVKAAYLTKISEYRAYIDAIQKSVALLTGAQLANEPRYQYLQAGEIHKYYNLLQANLTEQKSMIQIMLEELPNYYLNHDPDKVLVAYINQFMNNGFSEDEVKFYLNTKKTNEEIKAFENSLKLFFEELSLDAYYTNEISTSLNEQLDMIDEQLELIKQAINELEEVSFN